MLFKKFCAPSPQKTQIYIKLTLLPWFASELSYEGAGIGSAGEHRVWRSDGFYPQRPGERTPDSQRQDRT